MVAAWLINAFPGPFLPNTIVFKEMKPDWEAEFDGEIQMYSRLSSLQGSVVPLFYGVGLRCDSRRRGLVLSDVGGRQLGGVSYSEYGFDTLKSMVRESLAAIYRLGLSPCDANLVNCLVVGDRVVIVDHEQDEELDEDELECDVEQLIDAKTDGVMERHWAFHGPKEPRDPQALRAAHEAFKARYAVAMLGERAATDKQGRPRGTPLDRGSRLVAETS